MHLPTLIKTAKDNGASDLHLEPGLPLAMRVRGALKVSGDPATAAQLLEFARELIHPSDWEAFVARRSHDMSKTISGARCRINILHTSRGVGFAIRLLPSFETTLDSLNLHPDLNKFVEQTHGLILISGPMGSGKSSTMAALIQTINLTEARHIITVESPIEFTFRPRRAFIRQREVGRDTPSFEQALMDCLREDPDVLMVGEMRDPETMRLTLNVAETGHLVLATVHSATCAEALQRVVGAFPAEIQNNVSAQLADVLIGVISQRLQFRPDLGICVPECEILVPSNAIKAFIRAREFFKMPSFLETGANHGMWTFARYRTWLEKRTKFNMQFREAEAAIDEPEPVREPMPAPGPTTAHVPSAKPAATPPGNRIEIEPSEEFDTILKKPL